MYKKASKSNRLGRFSAAILLC